MIGGIIYVFYIQDLTWEDMLIAYSTLPGYVSNRDHYRGTWFIESICKVTQAITDSHILSPCPRLSWLMPRTWTSEICWMKLLGFSRNMRASLEPNKVLAMK